MFYRNVSISTKTFYGVEFKPGETKEVPGYINDMKMIAVDKPPVPEKPQPKKTEIKSDVKSKEE